MKLSPRVYIEIVNGLFILDCLYTKYLKKILFDEEIKIEKSTVSAITYIDFLLLHHGNISVQK